jgi:hypothetical protein
MKFAVSTGRNNSPDLPRRAREWAAELSLPYIPRAKEPVAEILAAHGLDGIILATVRGPELHSSGGRLFFHQGMSRLRIENIRKGRGDRLIEAMALTPGLSVLDCTLGLAADAAVASWVTGGAGTVVGLEATEPLAFVVAAGLKNYESKDRELTDALRRVRVVAADAAAYLAAAWDKSFDIVYLDPMFAHPLPDSCNMLPLRPLAARLSLDERLLNEAARVARRRVVLKTAGAFAPPAGYPFYAAAGGKYSRVKYLALETEA